MDHNATQPATFVYRSVSESHARGRDWFEAVIEYVDADGWLVTRKVGGSVSKARATDMALRAEYRRLAEALDVTVDDRTGEIRTDNPMAIRRMVEIARRLRS